jgi:pimeloyl-ACP methyl ester carboxylesterase
VKAHFICLASCGSLLFATCTFALDARSESAVVSDLSYVAPARLVNVGHGRKMNILCIGNGTPTVIFDAGLGDQIRAWATVQPQIARRTRACSYDRAGLGFSDPSNRPGTSLNAVDDLHELLIAASIKPPYVLVGHSLGGMYVRLYADKYRSKVAAMVLVDPVSEEQGRRYMALDVSTKTLNDRYVEWIYRECIPAAAMGFDRMSDIFKRCVGGPDPHFSAAFNDALAENESTAAHFQAVWSEWTNVFTTSSDQVRSARRGFGRMPLVVLSRAPFGLQSNETRKMRDAKNRLWMELHDDLAHLSARGVNRVIPGAGHYIQFDRPAAVVGAVFEVLDEIAIPSSEASGSRPKALEK